MPKGNFMSEHEKDIAFLRRCIIHDDSAERHKLEESITHLQSKERSLRRAIWAMTLFIGLALAGLCYSLVFMPDLPQTTSQFMTQFISKAFCVLGLGSVMCLIVFLCLGMVYRKQLDQRCDECRRLAVKVLEARPRNFKETTDTCVPFPNLDA